MVPKPGQVILPFSLVLTTGTYVANFFSGAFEAVLPL
jgi:hypothetical protein